MVANIFQQIKQNVQAATQRSALKPNPPSGFLQMGKGLGNAVAPTSGLSRLLRSKIIK